MTLEAGAQWIDITPRRSLPNYNGDEVKQGSGSLKAHVAVCTGSESVVFISIDSTFIDRTLVWRLRDAIQRRIKVPPKNILVTATHTHNAPATAVSFLSGAFPDPLYLDYLVKQVATAAEHAYEDLKPVRILTDTIDCPPIIACRRRLSPSGQVYLSGADPDPKWEAEQPIDQDIQFLALQTATQEYVMVLFNVPCHNHTTFIESPLTYDGDMFDRAGRILREELGSGVVTPALPAPCGDVTWQAPTGGSLIPGETGKERAQAGGRAIADRILDALSEVDPETEDQVESRSITKEIRDRGYRNSHFCRDGCRGSDDESQEQIRSRYDPEEEAVQLRGGTSCTVELSCIGVGPFAIVTNPAELFSVYGKRIKERSPHDVTIVSELTNGYCGYVPPPDSFEHGGYETHRTVYTSRLHKRAGDQIEDLSVELLDTMHRNHDAKSDSSVGDGQ